MEFENLNLNVFGLVLAWVAWNLEPKMLNLCTKYTQKCNGLERNQMVLKEPYMSLTYDRIACIINKNRSNGLERIAKIPSFLPCAGHIKQKWLNMQGV